MLGGHGQSQQEPVDRYRLDTRPDGGDTRIAARAAMHDEARHIVPTDRLSKA